MGWECCIGRGGQKDPFERGGISAERPQSRSLSVGRLSTARKSRCAAKTTAPGVRVSQSIELGGEQ